MQFLQRKNFLGDGVLLDGTDEGLPMIDARGFAAARVLKQGARVLDSNGQHIGNVEQLLTDGYSEQVSDFVVSQGVLQQSRKRIPITWVYFVTDEHIHLIVTAAGVKALPAFEDVTR